MKARLIRTGSARWATVAAAAVLCLACGSSKPGTSPDGMQPSDDAGDAAGEDSSGGSPSDPGSGGATGGTNNVGGSPGVSGSGGITAGTGGITGGGGSVSACESGVTSTDTCDAVGTACGVTNFCCRCIDFESASCGKQWSCAQPENNGTNCPAQPPEVGADCPIGRYVCQYCLPSGPRHFRCSSEAGAVTAKWSETAGLTCSS